MLVGADTTSWYIGLGLGAVVVVVAVIIVGTILILANRIADQAETDAYFASLATKLHKAKTIQSLGQGAFVTKNESAVVRKDYKVLTVDVSGLPPQFGSPPDPELYARIADAFPQAWIEDPALTPETLAVLEPHRERITWDAAIHEWSDVEALPFRPKCLNSKPSRFGSVRRLFDFYDACERDGIALYGGGQYELGAGRNQIQLLASLFHADAPNDVAPAGFNATEPLPGLPTPPLSLSPLPGVRV